MSRRDARELLQDMLDYATEAVGMMRGRARADLDSDRMLSLAVVRLLEIVGEAASQVPRDERARYPAIPWQAAIGMRNRLIHAYTAVDHDVVWEVVADDLPPLIATLSEVLGVQEA